MDVADFVFAGGILSVGVIVIAIFRENQRLAAQMDAYDRDRVARRARPDVPARAAVGRRTTAPAADGRRPFVEPEIRECDPVELRPRVAKRDRPAA